MTTLVTFDGDGLTDGQPLGAGSAGTGDTPIDAVSGAAITYTSQDPDFPDAFTVAPGADNGFVRWFLAAETFTFGFRFYFKKVAEYPGGNMQLLGGYDATSTQQQWRMAIAGSGTPGQTRLYGDSGTRINSPTNVWVPDVWYRLEGLFDITADTARSLIYAGHSTTPLFDSGVQTQGAANGAEQLWFGCTNTAVTPGTTLLANLAVTDDATTLIGPAVAPAGPPVLRGRIDEGGLLEPVTLRGCWDGAAMSAVTVREV